MTFFVSKDPNKLRFPRDKHSREHRDRVAAVHRTKAKIASAIAAWEVNSQRSPITLPRISIQQQDAE